ncbi:MCE family protein [Nocardia sp. NBC_00565]|uniref:MlaD family protein n=1 Tax=Nocardia sp. NBC_00565 TaxID=2975993 RepID=UPI002E7FDDF0|nr:MCE family protein [Nocardia sp. NBC_00565]WUC05629.1 MCE family protein [Nocardia sp. NBC_00565]
MPILFETDGRGPTPAQLLLRGIGAVLVATVLVTVLAAKMNGDFEKTFEVAAVLADVGDGLPAKSDVKFRGVLVGTVKDVTPSIDGGPNHVNIVLKQEYADGIPRTVTARVVPSNVFAVSSIQLVDNGAGPPLRAHAEIPQDQSLSTVQLQTALTKLRQIIAATTRLGSDHTLGMLAAVAAATDRRGADLVQAGAQLDRITRELSAVIVPNGDPSTLGALTDAVRGLQSSAPDLLDALHHAVVPMRTIAEMDAALTSLLSAGASTLSTVGTALDNNTDKLINITTQLSPVLGVFADGGTQFTPIVSRIKVISDKWFTEFWPPGANTGTGKFLLEFTPHRMYTRADCPRYGALAGPSCETAPATVAPPVIPTVMDPRTFSGVPMGGNVGPVGSPQEKELLDRILGGDLNAAAELLLGPLARGSTVSVAPDPGNGAR